MLVKVGMLTNCICVWFKLHEVDKNDVEYVVDRAKLVICGVTI